MNTNTSSLQRTVLALALAAAYPLHAYAVSAGVAQFAAGDVSLRGTDGSASPLVKGRDIESGQAIVTGASGRAQVRFSDGGLISLQPNTEFKIAAYADNAASPKDERFLVDLLRGSMRAITGLIGKRNRENYKVTTTTATIGIRGSGFNVGYNPDGSLGVTTELDAIEVCNAGGCVGLTAGESALIVNSTDAPQRSNVRAAVPTPGTARDVVVVGDKVNSEGKAAIITGGPRLPLTVAAHYRSSAIDSSGTLVAPQVSSLAVLNNGNLEQFNAGSNTFAPVTVSSSGSLGSVAGNDFIGWGNWADATKNGGNIVELHYVVGQATAVLPTTTGVLQYSLAAGTVTNYSGVSGVVNAATSNLKVHFGSPSPYMEVGIYTSLGDVTQNYLYFSSSSFSNGSNIQGIFTGPNANRAGLVYSGPGNSEPISGTAIFQAP